MLIKKKNFYETSCIKAIHVLFNLTSENSIFDTDI